MITLFFAFSRLWMTSELWKRRRGGGRSLSSTRQQKTISASHFSLFHLLPPQTCQLCTEGNYALTLQCLLLWLPSATTDRSLDRLSGSNLFTQRVRAGFFCSFFCLLSCFHVFMFFCSFFCLFCSVSWVSNTATRVFVSFLLVLETKGN